MVNYRRVRNVNGYYFFTVTLFDRKKNYLIKYIEILRSAFKSAKLKYRFHIDAIVILPEHLHAIFIFDGKDHAYSKCWRHIKSYFTSRVRKYENLSRDNRGEYNLWQKRYWEHTIQNVEDYNRHKLYIYYNPVKHGLVKHVQDWPYSSYHKQLDSQKIEFDIEFETIENFEYGE